ncbi:MAG: cytochrome c-type biogenesis protein CcmH [Micromonospora sp.]
MSWRRYAAAAVLALLAAAAVTGLIRSMAVARGGDPVQQISAGLRCPACQGESVADSRSPIAVAMRQAVADQVAQGRDRDEIERWFVQRYGEEVLAEPPARGPGLLLWSVPPLALLAAAFAALRTLRPRPGPPVAAPTGPPPRRDGERPGRSARRAWWIGAVGLVGVVASVALAAGRPSGDPGEEPADPATVAVLLARDMEQQNRYAAAANLYRQALRTRPDDELRLRLAFALLRAGDAAAAADQARQVLATTRDSPDGLLVLGLAQRETAPEDSRKTLRRFLTVAPNHPAAAEITRLVATRS